MFDIAYLNEATISAATIEKEKLWQKILKTDNRFKMFCLGLDIERLVDFIEYSSIMFYTHGT